MKRQNLTMAQVQRQGGYGKGWPNEALSTGCKVYWDAKPELESFGKLDVDNLNGDVEVWDNYGKYQTPIRAPTSDNASFRGTRYTKKVTDNGNPQYPK